MALEFTSLAVIALVAFVCPIIARLVPGKLVPETVFLLIAGALLGPHLAGVIQTTEAIDLLSELGLAFLFLLAGYEIDPTTLTGSQGKRGLVTWVVSIVLAFIAVRLSPDFSVSHFDGIAVAIAMQFGIPISHVGLGEGMRDLRPFEPETFTKALLDTKE